MNLKVLRQFWVHVFLLLVILQSVSKCEQVSNDIISKSLNTKSDANLRRALLKALQELENEDKKDASNDNYEEKTLQKAKASIVSVITDSFGNSRSITATPSPSYVRYVTKAPQNDNISLHLSSKLKLAKEGETESNLLTSASQNIVFSGIDNKISEQHTRSAINRGNNNLIVSSEKIPKKDTFRAYTTRSTTTTSTTTTIQPPTSSTEEHEAKVEDVQFFQAPLVAAFTVHQDEKGLPKKVEAIYKPSTESPLDKQSKNDQLKKNLYAQQQQEITRLQLALQLKQEALKQQLLGFPNQDLLYRQQQLLREQQLTNEETLKQLENKQPPAPPSLGLQSPSFPISPNKFKNTQNFFGNNPAEVSIQQSISSVPSNDFFLPTIPPFSPTAPPLINNPPQLSSFSNLPQSQPILSSFNSGGVSLIPSISSSYKESSFITGPTIYSQQQLPDKEPVIYIVFVIYYAILVPILRDPFFTISTFSVTTRSICQDFPSPSSSHVVIHKYCFKYFIQTEIFENNSKKREISLEDIDYVMKI
ncbi:uncharacterized protein LOC108734351 isoform X2 [Agrilus planipennis]|uniref:Uncharacterized protein LOC108734351 isoform X2 n=1 Tax=Agrilus planipennis TaxID=224129 RepID=A0A1W4WBL4_AGRPL|nr:uncharacterized protein LOC108734351 isoform X2 [Agrilus planipennis]